MRDLTPEHLRCSMGGCEAVYEMEDITPPHLKCAIAASCPSVSKIGDGRQLLIIGKKPSAEHMAEIKDRVGPDEEAIVIGAEYFTGLVQTRAEPVENPSGHPRPEFEAMATEIAEDIWRATASDGELRAKHYIAQQVSTALREAYETGAVEGQNPIIENLKARVAELEARLEMDHTFEMGDDDELVRVEIAPADRSFCGDGIECRDESLKSYNDALVKMSLAMTEQAIRIAELESRDVCPARQEAPEGCPVLPKAASPH